MAGQSTVNDLNLEFEWIDPAEARGQELRATWARFEMTLAGDPITRVIDGASRSVRSSLFLPLYPLAEWIATHWWVLFYEVETLGRSTSDEYDRRHNLRNGAEGFALPSLTIQPMGEQVKLDWRPMRLASRNLEFTGSGSAHVSTARLQQTFSDFITAVLGRLADQGVENTLLEREWTGIQTLDSEEVEFCSTAAALGVDPFTLDEQKQQEIVTVSESLPASLLRDFFAAADFSALPTQAHQVLEALARSRENSANLESLKSLRREVTGGEMPKGSPWRQGYQFAQDLRQRLNLNGTKLNSLLSLGRALDTPVRELEDAIIKMAPLPGSLDALVATNSLRSPGFAVPDRRQEEAIRFAFCRALFEYMTTPEGEPLLVTRARSERQKRNRAFAAEFLVPANLLREELPSHIVGDEDIEDVAAIFGVSPYVVRHQIENHGLALSLPD